MSSDELYQKGVAELAEVVGMTLAKGVLPGELVIDFVNRARTGLLHWDCVRSPCSVPGKSSEASVRVDGMIRRIVRGRGISRELALIGLTRLLSQLFRYGVVTARSQAYTKLLIVPLTSDATTNAYAENFALRLRQWDVPCEISLVGGGKVSKHIEYATKKGIPFIGFIGETEVADGTVAVKRSPGEDAGKYPDFE